MGVQWRQPICVNEPWQNATVPEWFAVQVWSGREHNSAKHLQLRGYEVFLPSYCELRRWTDRVKTVDRALFTGYLFCRVGALAVGTIVAAPGVVRIVSDRSGPLPVPAHEIEAIQRIIEARLTVEPWRVPEVGQTVRIEQGPLRGIEGTVEIVKNRHRLVVLISLLNRAVAAEIDAEWVTIPRPMLTR